MNSGKMLEIVARVAWIGMVSWIGVSEYRAKRMKTKALYVEQTCEYMRAAYKAEVLKYDRWRGEEGADGAHAKLSKIRAEKIESDFRRFVSENSDVWGGNTPYSIGCEIFYIRQKETE